MTSGSVFVCLTYSLGFEIYYNPCTIYFLPLFECAAACVCCCLLLLLVAAAEDVLLCEVCGT